MAVVTIDAEIQARFAAVAAPDEEFDTFIAQVIQEALARRERELAARAEAQAILNGPRRPLAESSAAFRLKYNIPDLSHLTHDEIADDAEHIVAALNPQIRAELEQDGWL